MAGRHHGPQRLPREQELAGDVAAGEVVDDGEVEGAGVETGDLLAGVEMRDAGLDDRELRPEARSRYCSRSIGMCGVDPMRSTDITPPARRASATATSRFASVVRACSAKT
jgi:hypothetical protein